MKALVTTTAAAMIFATTAFGAAHEGVSPEIITKIMSMLEGMNCQMDPSDIEVEDGGYELDDVICEGGKQFDIELDKDLNEVGRRAE